MSGKDDDLRGIPESRLRAIFRRAIEIDHLAPSRIDLKELYDIASEVGVSPDALEQAVREAREGQERRQRTARTARAFRRAITGIVAAVIGLGAKFFTVLVTSASPAFVLNVIVPLTLFSVVLAVYSRRRGDNGIFQKDNAGLWLGFGLGWVMVGQTLPADLVPPVLGWSLTALLGYFIVRKGRNEPPDAGGVEATPGRLIASRSTEQDDDGQFGGRQLQFVQDWIVARIVRARLAGT